MRVMLGLVLVALAAVPTAAGERQEATVTGAELRAYLTKAGAIAPKYVTWNGNALRAIQTAPLVWSLDDPETTASMVRTLRRAENELTPLATRMRKIVATGDLKPLHTGFTRSVATEVKCTAQVRAVVENGGNPRTMAGRCEDTFAATTERQKHWRTEITVAARRLGVILPFWVKKVGTPVK